MKFKVKKEGSMRMFVKSIVKPQKSEFLARKNSHRVIHSLKLLIFITMIVIC